MTDERSQEPTHAEVTLPPLAGAAAVLDLCCGGEGVVARAYAGRVIGVDLLYSEIKECRPKCPADTIFLVADATHTQFVDQSFNDVTVFFGLMYIRGPAARRALLAEATRVLKPGGRLHVWDAAMPAGAAHFTVRVDATLPGGDVVRAGYGVRGPTEELSLGTLTAMAAAAGLAPAAAEDHGGWFYAAFAKPSRG